MDYTMESASIKDKRQTKMTISPTTNLEREFFNNLFTSGNAVIETIANSDEITITVKDKIPLIEEKPSS